LKFGKFLSVFVKKYLRLLYLTEAQFGADFFLDPLFLVHFGAPPVEAIFFSFCSETFHKYVHTFQSR
jgi:hypothetical protein